MSSPPAYLPVIPSDFEALADIRVAAMRESLERVGRFDPTRARDRLRATFIPESTFWIVADGVNAGFYATREALEGLWLDHLYILPAHQSCGLGTGALQRVFAEADARDLPVHVGALKESASNRFYMRHGFVLASSGEWDNYYTRPASTPCDQELVIPAPPDSAPGSKRKCPCTSSSFSSSCWA